VRVLEPRGVRLTNLSILCSAIVTALTAGPALGGAQFTESSARLFNITDDSLVWRLLCFAAMVLSLVAAIATNLYKSHDIATRLAKAEACSAALEGWRRSSSSAGCRWPRLSSSISRLWPRYRSSTKNHPPLAE
jgi:hypothetical protein